MSQQGSLLGTMELMEFLHLLDLVANEIIDLVPVWTTADFIKVAWKLRRCQEWATWLGLERDMGGEDIRVHILKCICAKCFAPGFKKNSAFRFVCSTGASVKKTLLRSVRNCGQFFAQGSVNYVPQLAIRDCNCKEVPTGPTLR
ncbi:hypothetical protein EDB80DRAFT_689339 [Ilyonectria destructans]|nr:hypothetical protein EDB80DRAFT_689339 [Ilyonectria destructans]